MDYATFQITVVNDTVFKHWQDLHRYVRDSIISVGLYSEFSQMDADCRALEICVNCLSATYNLNSKTITKTFRVADGNAAVAVYNRYLTHNLTSIQELYASGLVYKEMTVEHNIKSNLSIINDAIQQIPSVIIPKIKFPLLKNLQSVYTVHTDHGVMKVKQDYIEYWFNDGSLDYLYTADFNHRLHSLYYKMYKRGFVNNDVIRFAFFKIYDYGNYMSLSAPTENRGTCDLFDDCTVINTDYINLYIDQSAELIHEWKQISDIFPNDPIRLENRIKDNDGYYFVLLGSNLDQTLPNFINLQLEYLIQIIDYLNCIDIDKTAVFNYALQKWTTDQLLISNTTQVPLFSD